MDIVRQPDVLRAACDAARARGERVGLVPTMGALHAGHLSLLAEAKRHSDFVVVTIFVNPTQFGPGEDLDCYPRTLEDDVRRCRDAGASLIFAPNKSAMYLPHDETRVRVAATASALCGAHRPGHFEGVCTVVTKLFSLVGRCTAVFGRKDFQQVQVIRRFTADLFLPVTVVASPIVREKDGLALSSRNAYLSPSERERALSLSRGLAAAVAGFERGERRVGRLREVAREVLQPAVDSIDYIEIADVDRVTPLADTGEVADRALLAVAATVGNTRLIDNVVLGEDPAPGARE